MPAADCELVGTDSGPLDGFHYDNTVIQNHCFSKEEFVIRLFEVVARNPRAQEVHRVRVYEDSCRQDTGNPGTVGRHLPFPGAQNTCVC